LATAASLAGASLIVPPGGAVRAQGGFNWRRYAGTRLRGLTLKFPLSEIQQARLQDFERETGVKVQWEIVPEGLWRQKVKVEHLAGSSDLDVFLSYYAQEGKQFFTSGWYTDLKRLIDDPAQTSPEFQWSDFLPNLREAATIQGQVPIIPDRASA